MAFDINQLTPEQIQKGMACKSIDEFKAFVEDEGFDLDEGEAEAFFEEMYATGLSDDELEAVAGGMDWCDCNTGHECTAFHPHRRRKK